jgi:LPXTG-motif cell wall-anchored protein
VAGTVGDTIGNLADSAAKLWSVDYLTDKFGDGKARPELVWDGRQVVPATGTPLTGYSSGSNNLLIVGGLAAVGLALVFMGRK